MPRCTLQRHKTQSALSAECRRRRLLWLGHVVREGPTVTQRLTKPWRWQLTPRTTLQAFLADWCAMLQRRSLSFNPLLVKLFQRPPTLPLRPDSGPCKRMHLFDILKGVLSREYCTTPWFYPCTSSHMRVSPRVHNPSCALWGIIYGLAISITTDHRLSIRQQQHNLSHYYS